MDKNYKVYHLKIPGIDKEMFKTPFYLKNKCEKIPFNGIISEHKIKSADATDYITLAPKFDVIIITVSLKFTVLP